MLLIVREVPEDTTVVDAPAIPAAIGSVAAVAEPKPGEGNALFGTMLLHTSASACNSFVFSSGSFGVNEDVVVVLAVVGVVKLMHVLIEGMIGMIGMTTGRERENFNTGRHGYLFVHKINSLVTCGCGFVTGPWARLFTENSGIQSERAVLMERKEKITHGRI